MDLLHEYPEHLYPEHVSAFRSQTAATMGYIVHSGSSGKYSLLIGYSKEPQSF